MRYEINFRIKLIALFIVTFILSSTASIITMLIVRDRRVDNHIYNPISNEIVEVNVNDSLKDSKEDNINNSIEENVEIVDIPEVVEEEEPVTSDATYTDDEIDLISIITMAEAEGESELGQRLVIDVILNRVESGSFPSTVNGVIYQKNQFTCTYDGRADRCYVKDEIRALVLEEIESRTNSEVLFFRAGQYHNFGTPVIQEGKHYFSK